ncbi:MAG: type 4a pilus biogenesis protein PilO [Gammaproteobacteria bacterium]|jgi:type IV pilus assembly protein PilO|nr:type 4a pilus biogenesis protein PilO [Gammaproteobacteria bacterium]
MKLDMNMNFLEELQNLDINDIGRWPFVFRAIFVSLTFVVATSGGYYYFVFEQKVPLLERAEAEELDLRRNFEAKQRKAANLYAYKDQLADIERSFGTMLQQLPGKTEIPNLLVDISQTGLAAGLDEKLFRPQAEIRKGFYAEKPIRIVLKGGYHEFGNFVSDIAALPRIVTLHDIDISPNDSQNKSGTDDLVLSVLAKTYRYLDENEAAE